jgi:hypothetical protein
MEFRNQQSIEDFGVNPECHIKGHQRWSFESRSKHGKIGEQKGATKVTRNSYWYSHIKKCRTLVFDESRDLIILFKLVNAAN